MAWRGVYLLLSVSFSLRAAACRRGNKRAHCGRNDEYNQAEMSNIFLRSVESLLLSRSR